LSTKRSPVHFQIKLNISVWHITRWDSQYWFKTSHSRTPVSIWTSPTFAYVCAVN